MKAVLEFSLPEERSEHAIALKGSAAHAVLGELDDWLRACIKYGGGELNEEMAEIVRDKLRLAAEARDVKISGEYEL